MSNESTELTAFREEYMKEIALKKKEIAVKREISKTQEIYNKAALVYKYLEEPAIRAKDMWLGMGENRWTGEGVILRDKWLYYDEKFRIAVQDYIKRTQF